MGLPTTASHAIWFFAMIGAIGTVLGFAFEHQEDLDASRAARRGIDAERLHARFEDGTFCHDEATGRVVYEVTNAGTLPINATDLTLLMDGRPVSSFEIDNAARAGSHLWLPEEVAYLNVTGVADAPGRLAMFTRHGAAYFPERITCRILTTIALTPSSASLAIGESATFSAAGFDQYGDPYPAASIAFASAAGAVTTLDATSARLTAGTTAGTFTFNATSGAVTGTATVVVRPDAPVSVAVSPDPADVPAGGTQAFAADVRDQHGNLNSTAPVSWSTTAGSITSGGVLTAQTTAQDGLSVTATVGALSDAATVNVVPGPVSRVVVAPSTATVKAGQTQAFGATAYDAYDNVVTGATFAWSATRGGVDAAGLYAAPSTVGSDEVAASVDGVSGQAVVTVTADVHVLDVSTYKAGVATTTFTRGETVEARVTVRDHNGNLVQGVNATVEFVRPNGQVDATVSGTTDAAGVASASHTLPSGSPGSWTVRVASLSGANFTYASASDVETQMTISVS